MAVYERSYKRYTGALTPQWTRFLVLTRYTFQDVFKSKLFVGFFVAAFGFPLFMAAVIYIRHNASFLQAFPDVQLDAFLAVDAKFFYRLMAVQVWYAFVLALIVGPGLVSRDLANNGLPLYLCRPFSRTEYMLGKLSVLALLLSAVTWVPGWALFALQGSYAGWGWMADNARLAVAVWVGSWAWICLVSLMALAFSAWVKWRPVAGFLMLLVLLAGNWFAGITGLLFKVEWVRIFDLMAVVNTVCKGLLGMPLSPGFGVGAAWLALALFTGLCLFMLHRKIRAYEVVK